MTLRGADIIRSPLATGDTDLPIVTYRSKLIKDIVDGGGTPLCMWDTGLEWCYPGGPISSRAAADDPADGAPLYDMVSETAGSVVKPVGADIQWAGGGFDLSANTKGGAVMKSPAGCLASLHAAANDYFMWWGIYKLPTEAECVAGGGGLFQTSADGAIYTTVPDLFSLTMASGTNPFLTFRRQTAVGTVSNMNVFLRPGSDATNPSTVTFGQVVFLRFIRTAGYVRSTLINAAGSKTEAVTLTIGSNNSADYSALVPKWGAPDGLNASSMTTAQQNGTSVRCFGGGLADLNGFTGSPEGVSESYWARVIARGDFS